MKSTVEPLDDNKVKVSVEVDEQEFEEAVNAAFRRIAKEVRLPGFRPGKAPRKVLEARMGKEAGREEALRESLPGYYSKAVIEHDVDVIASPDIDITSGHQDGPVTFDAVVEVRPNLTVTGYENLTVEIPPPTASEEDIDQQIERLRTQFGELTEADRPVQAGDQLVIDIEGRHEGEVVEGLTHEDWAWQIGSYEQIPEIDDNLLGLSVGEVVEFEAEHPDEDEEAKLEFRIEVKKVQEIVLPDADDEWAKDASEFETVDDLRDDIRSTLNAQKKAQAYTAATDETARAAGELIDLDLVPEALLEGELSSQLEQFVMRLQSQGIEPAQWLQMTGTGPEELREQFREQAEISVRVDLALRAIADAENIEVTEADLDAEFEPVVGQFGETIEAVKAKFAETGQLSAVRSDIRKRNALDWLAERVTLVDPDGTPIDRADLEPDPEPEPDPEERVQPTETAPAEEIAE